MNLHLITFPVVMGGVGVGDHKLRLALPFELDDNVGYSLIGIQLQQHSARNEIKIGKMSMRAIKEYPDGHDGLLLELGSQHQERKVPVNRNATC